MALQPFGRWGPDNYNLNSGLAGEALGVMPGANSYLPWPQMAAASAALASACRGAFMARTTTNAAAIFAARATKLFKFASITSWTDFTRLAGGDYALATDDLWQFVQFGTLVYACQITDALQSVDASSGSNFAAASGSPPKARYIAVVGDHLMLGNTETDSRQVRWSGLNDPGTWTAGTKRASNQIFPDGGDVMGIAGWEQGGLVLQTEIVRQMQIVADSRIFTFRRIETAQGTLAPYSMISRQGTVYYYGVNGFQRISIDGASAAIGANWVDQWFLANSNAATRPKAIVGSADPASPRVFWLAAANGNATSSIFDFAVCYDPTLIESEYGPWTHAPLSASLVFPAATTATTLENLGSAGLGYTLETVPYSLDADIWKGGAPRIGAFDSAFKMNFLTGTPQAAVLQTGIFEPIEGKRAYVNGFRFVGDSPDAVGRWYTSERPQATESPTGTNTVNGQGIVHKRASGKYLRAEVTIPAGSAWTKAAGVDMSDEGLVTQDGQR